MLDSSFHPTPFLTQLYLPFQRSLYQWYLTTSLTENTKVICPSSFSLSNNSTSTPFLTQLYLPFQRLLYQWCLTTSLTVRILKFYVLPLSVCLIILPVRSVYQTHWWGFDRLRFLFDLQHFGRLPQILTGPRQDFIGIWKKKTNVWTS